VEAGRRIVGRKIGLTSEVVQRQLGVDQPDFGVLLADMCLTSGEAVPYGSVVQPRVEAEVALVLNRDLVEPDVTIAELLARSSTWCRRSRWFGSRIAGWDITIVDTVADNASSGLFVLGTRPVKPGDIELRDLAMELSIDGTVVSTGVWFSVPRAPVPGRAVACPSPRRGGHAAAGGRRGDDGCTGSDGAVGAGCSGGGDDRGSRHGAHLGWRGACMSLSPNGRWPVAIIGSGNIGTDLMIKVLRRSTRLSMAAMVGIDPESDGLQRASRMGVPTTSDGVEGLMALLGFADVKLVFDATSASAHRSNWAQLEPIGVRMLDLTPAAIGPYCVPVVNLDDHLDAPNLNMVTCGGQATVPIVAAVSRVALVSYAEMVSSIASKSAGPGTRANIDEFTETTSRALEVVGGAVRGKAVIILNPAEPPLMMRNTVYC